jgi:diphthine synthase
MSNGLTLISTGIHDERDISLRGLEKARECDTLYAELYTMILDTDTQRLSTLLGKKVDPLRRRGLEEQSDEILEKALTQRVGILIGGDCLSATTHVSLLIEAKKRGIPVEVVHASSIFTAVAETGLSLYKFGRTVTLPLPERGPPDTTLDVLKENKEQGLHTLILLDLDAEKGRHLPLPRAISILLDAQKPEEFSPDTLCVATARLGWEDSTIRADRAAELKRLDAGLPPHALIVPGRLHFMEAEALKVIGGCPEEAIQGHAPRGVLARLIEKYGASCRKAVEELEHSDLPSTIAKEAVENLIGHAVRYLEDAEYYATERRATALASVSYAEGILDALRLLGLVDFEW